MCFEMKYDYSFLMFFDEIICIKICICIYDKVGKVDFNNML